MTENQHNKNLQILRDEIDAIDKQIIELIKSRMLIIPRVSELKKNNNEKFYIKSAREADMIKNLVSKVEGNYLKQAVASIWRKIICVANMEEQVLKIGIHNPRSIADYEYLVKDHFLAQANITNFDSATNLIAEMQNGSINIGVFLLPGDNDDFDKKDSFQENWWINMANNQIGLKIYCKIPFVEFSSNKKMSNISLVATAIKSPEQSMQDSTIICLEANSQFSKSQIIALFKDNNLNAKILKSVKIQQLLGIVFYLIELDGFYLEDNLILKKLSQSNIKPFIKVLGHFPTPIILN
jgi:chorismate mutase